jgi:hypothetical protein
MMLLLASHKCESIDEVYLDEKPATPTLLSRTLNGVDYWWTTRTAFKATGKDGHTKNNELARFSFRMGDDDQVAEPFLLTPIYQSPNARALESIGWTENDRSIRNIVYYLLVVLQGCGDSSHRLKRPIPISPLRCYTDRSPKPTPRHAVDFNLGLLRLPSLNVEIPSWKRVDRVCSNRRKLGANGDKRRVHRVRRIVWDNIKL